MSRDDIIQLNVGGVPYTTTRSTLCRYPESMLCAMFSRRHDCKVDDRGCVFIDRDGSMFKYILNFLRSGKLSFPDGFRDRNHLAVEADYFQIQPLVHELNAGDRKTVHLIEIVESRIERRHLKDIIIFGERHILEMYVTLTEMNCVDEAGGYARVIESAGRSTFNRVSLRTALINDGWILRRTSTTSSANDSGHVYSVREEFEKVDLV